ncbi:MAG: nuclear transport factor 2 family protein [Actinobacteria bacterium]|nr:nuclear transport factor 2 family protein [Actinomycetota bacterium]
MAEQQQLLNEQFVQSFIERMVIARNSADADKIAALCNEDVILEETTRDDALRGREELREFFGGLIRRRIEFTLELQGEPYLSLDATRAAARWRGTGIAIDGGRSYSFENVEIYEFENDQLSSWTMMFRDPDWMGRQVP